MGVALRKDKINFIEKTSQDLRTHLGLRAIHQLQGRALKSVFHLSFKLNQTNMYA